jgi:hypothetical protein
MSFEALLIGRGRALVSNAIFRLRLLVGIPVGAAAWRAYRFAIGGSRAALLHVWAPAILMMGSLIPGGSLVDVAVRSAVALVGLRALTATGLALAGERTTVRIAVFYLLAVSATHGLQPSGPLTAINQKPLVLNAEPASVRTVIALHPDSPRWAKIDRQASRPYVYLAIPNASEAANIAVSVDGMDIGTVASVPGASVASGSMAIPIDWGILKGKQEVKIDVRLDPKAILYFPSEVVIPLRGRVSPQDILLNGRWRPTAEVLDAPLRLIVEIRIADAERRNLGILY